MSVAFHERWADPPEHTGADPATVPAGAPATAGDQPWVMAGGWNLFPPVPVPGLNPPQILRIVDQADPSEIILVRDSRTATWQVTRGDQGTTPVAHLPGFAVRNAVTAAGLSALAQGVPSGNGLLLPRAGRSTWQTWIDNAEHDVASLPVPAGEAVPGSTYEAMAWGSYATNNAAGRVLGVILRWGGIAIGSNDFPVAAVPNGGDARWRVQSVINILAGPRAHATSMVMIADRLGVDLAQTPDTYLLGPADAEGSDSTRAIVTNADVTFRLTLSRPGTPINQTLLVLGSRIWKAA